MIKRRRLQLAAATTILGGVAAFAACSEDSDQPTLALDAGTGPDASYGRDSGQIAYPADGGVDSGGDASDAGALCGNVDPSLCVGNVLPRCADLQRAIEAGAPAPTFDKVTRKLTFKVATRAPLLGTSSVRSTVSPYCYGAPSGSSVTLTVPASIDGGVVTVDYLGLTEDGGALAQPQQPCGDIVVDLKDVCCTTGTVTVVAYWDAERDTVTSSCPDGG